MAKHKKFVGYSNEAIIKCITCQYCVMIEIGKNQCYAEKIENRVIIDSIKVRDCDRWKLAPMHNVRSREKFKL